MALIYLYILFFKLWLEDEGGCSHPLEWCLGRYDESMFVFPTYFHIIFLRSWARCGPLLRHGLPALLCVSHALRWQLPIFWHLKFEFQVQPMISTTRVVLFLKRGRSVLARQVIAAHSGEADARFCG